MTSRRALVGVVLTLPALGFTPTVLATSSPLTVHDGLSGTWHVSRACVSGCVGTTTLTEVVRPYRGAIFMAAGSASMLLYQIGKQKVLVYAATSSSLLTIRNPGQLMRGPGVGQDGSVFRATWRCVAATEAKVSLLGRRFAVLRPDAMSDARGIC